MGKYSEQASKRPVGPFGSPAKPARASAFISVSILMDTEALAGFAMPARASVFDSIYSLVNAEALTGFEPKCPNPLLHFVMSAVCLVSSENLRFSASGGPLGVPQKPPANFCSNFAGGFVRTP